MNRKLTKGGKKCAHIEWPPLPPQTAEAGWSWGTATHPAKATRNCTTTAGGATWGTTGGAAAPRRWRAAAPSAASRWPWTRSSCRPAAWTQCGSTRWTAPAPSSTCGSVPTRAGASAGSPRTPWGGSSVRVSPHFTSHQATTSHLSAYF